MAGYAWFTALAVLAACGGTAPAPAQPGPGAPPPGDGRAAGSGAGDAVGPGQERPVVAESTDSAGEGATAAAPIECNRADQFGPSRVSAETYAARHGAQTRKLSELEASKSRPVEVCGVAEQLDFLMATQCADGSSPFTHRTEAHNARSGSVGPGGRCDAIIDLYEVTCPETTYSVFIDMYFCQAGQSWL